MTKHAIDPEHLKPLFYWAGLTLHACQQLEYGAKLLVVTMAELGFGGFKLADAIAIIEDEKKKTLGEVLRYLRQRVTLSDGWVASLEQGLDARNRFIHGFLIDSAERIVDPSTRPDVVRDVKEIRKLVLSADSAVRQILETLHTYSGVEWQRQQQQWAAEVRAMNEAPGEG